jgi:hypothetical protein
MSNTGNEKHHIMSAACPIPGCERPAQPTGARFCDAHWRCVPGNLRRMLFDAYNGDQGRTFHPNGQVRSRSKHRNTDSDRYRTALRTVIDFAARALEFIETPTGNADRPTEECSNPASPGWVAGKGTRVKAVARAAQTGETFEEALQAIRDGMIRAREARDERTRQENDERADEREQLKRERADVFPKPPRSVRAIPTGIETNRRRH